MKEEIAAQEALFPKAAAVPLSSTESEVAAELYKKIKRPRGREADIAIAACALTHEARLWALNKTDFKDIPGLDLLF